MTEELKARIAQINAGTAPAGYKKTKVGIVPEEWKVKRLGEILTQRKTLMCVSDDAPLLSFTIEEGVIEPSQKKSNKRDFLIKDMTTKKFALTEVGDIIYNPANLKFGAIHRNNLRRGVVSPIYGIFYGNQDSRYMGYLLHNQRFIDYAKIYTEGTVEKLKTLKADTFLMLKVALPPLPEQQKIAEILTAQDAVIALMQKQIELLQKQKKAFLQKMFPKKGCNVPEIRFAGFTDAWEQRKLGDCVEFLDTMRKPLKESEREKGEYPYYGASGIVDYVSDYIFDEELVLLSEDGANITDRNYPVCFLASGKYWVNNHAHVLKVNDGNENNFICNSLERMDFTQYNSGMAMPKLNKEVCYNIPLSCPVYEEQKQIGDYFRNLDTLITLHQRKLEFEQKKKKALMQLLLTGKVRVKT